MIKSSVIGYLHIYGWILLIGWVGIFPNVGADFFGSSGDVGGEVFKYFYSPKSYLVHKTW